MENRMKFLFFEGKRSGFFLLLSLLLIATACDTSRRGHNGDRSVERPPLSDRLDKEKEGNETEEPDSEIGVTDPVKEDEDIPVEEASPKLSSYKVLVLLPFMTNRFDRTEARFNSISEWSLHYYGGMKMALDELRTQDLGLELNIVDTKGSEAVIDKLLNDGENVGDAHLIIGPYRRANIQKIAVYARDKDINMVSPYSAADNLVNDNPHFIQVRPSLETHCQSLLRHALQRHSPDNIVLVGQDRALERKSFEHFQEARFLQAGTRYVDPLEEYLVDGDNEAFQSMNVKPLLEGRDTAVFVVSAWSGDDETFVYSFLRLLELNRLPEQQVVVYGTPVWQDYDRIDLDYFEKLNVHLSSHAFIDSSDPDVQEFRRDYFDRFATLPAEEAFLGYDTMLYFGKMLKKYGLRFEHDLEKEEQTGLHTRFHFERVVDNPLTTGQENLPIQQYENKYVNILKFVNYQFVLD